MSVHKQGFASQLLRGTFGELPLVGFAFKDFNGIPTAFGYAPQLEDSLRSSPKVAHAHPKAALTEIRSMGFGCVADTAWEPAAKRVRIQPWSNVTKTVKAKCLRPLAINIAVPCFFGIIVAESHRSSLFNMNITVISSSPRQESVSNRIALFLEKRLKAETSHTIQLVDVRDWLDWDTGQPVYRSIAECPPAFQPLAEIMFNTDAFVIVSPEYNGGMPYSLKKLFDFFPKQSHKVFAIATSSTGALGGIRASLAIQHFVAALFGILAPHMLITPKVTEKFDEQGNLLDDSFQKNIATFLRELLWLMGRIGGN